MQWLLFVCATMCCLGFATEVSKFDYQDMMKAEDLSRGSIQQSEADTATPEVLETEIHLDPKAADDVIARPKRKVKPDDVTERPEREIKSDDVPERSEREVKLNAKQNLIINQVIAAYALSGTKTPLCKNHTLEFKQALRSFQPWALKMFDSSSKLQAGVLMGNLMEYGSFRQCVEVYANSGSGPIRGQHCALKVTPDDWLLRYIMSLRNISARRFKTARKIMLDAGLFWSVCVPDSCTKEDILPHFTRTILSATEGLTLNISLGDYDCYSWKDEPPLDTTEWLVIILFGILVLIIVVSTTVDVYRNNSGVESPQVVRVLSAFCNVKKLLAVPSKKQPLDCLYGFRVISMGCVVAGHNYFMAMVYPFINAFNFIDWTQYYTSAVIVGGTVCVDTFFMTSGLLMAYNFFEAMSKKRFNLFRFYLQRYLRVTPSLMVVVLVHATLVHRFGSAPLWKNSLRAVQEPCRHFWWSAMLHVQNYVNSRNICVLQTWYLSCDTQYYFLSPLIVYPLWKWSGCGYVLLAACYILSVAINFYVAWENQFNVLDLQSNQLLASDYFSYHYIASHVRASPFIIGIAFGYILFKTKNMRIRMSLATLSLGWATSFALLVAPVLGTYPFQLEDHDYNRLEHAFFLSLSRSAWTLGVVWIVWVCRSGYGGPVDYFLSLPTFQILNRLSYGVFLVHLGNQFLLYGASKSSQEFTDLRMMYNSFADIVLSLAMSFVLTLLVESPMISATSLLMRGLFGKVQERPGELMDVTLSQVPVKTQQLN